MSWRWSVSEHDSIERRHALAAHLARIPASCPIDLHGWAEEGYSVEIDDDYEDVTVPHPNTSSGAQCAMNAAVHKHGCCYCGKFRTGLEVTDGR